MKLIILLVLISYVDCNFDYNPDESYKMLLFSSAAYRVGKTPAPLEFLQQKRPGEVQALQVVTTPCQFDSVCACIVSLMTSGDIVVSFRGTAAPMQLIDEIMNAAEEREKSDIGGLVEPFFQEAHVGLWPRVIRFVDQFTGKSTNRTIYVTGHSLGGALAALFAARLVSLGYPSQQVKVITFGEPRVGDLEFATNYDKLVPQTWRVIHHRDIVPHIPPCQIIPWKACTQNESYYYHHGTEVFYAAEKMTKDSAYQICTGSPRNEDGTCSNAIIGKEPCITMVSCVNDHLVYFGEEVAFWKIPFVNCK